MKKNITEFVGTAFLVMVVIGSGIMADNLSNGNDAITLLGNTIATGAILFVLIKMFTDVSGAHFNPIVSLIFLIKKELTPNEFISYLFFQFLGGILAVFLVHYIFDLTIFQLSDNYRAGYPKLVSEIIAAFGLLSTILFIRKFDPSSVALGVGLFITAGYWFTSSTSFANPAITIARVFTNTFTGISPESILYFFTGQIIGALLALYFFNLTD